MVFSRVRLLLPAGRRVRMKLPTALAAAGCLVLVVGVRSAVPAAVSVTNVPYALPVVLQGEASSPPVDPAAPYTPRVQSLIGQLLPDSPPAPQALQELQNADNLFATSITASSPGCNNQIGKVPAPTGTTPGIAPMCWSDAQGINIAGPNAGKTTAPQELLGLASSFDLRLANAWGQAEGSEGREAMVTGLYGPQADLL